LWPASKCSLWLLLAVGGSADGGKSTLVAVLTHGTDGQPSLDNGHGRARMNILRHKHELVTGRTSSLSAQSLGYDEAGRVLNYGGVTAMTPAEVGAASSKLVTFLDMGGHEKAFKTTLYGLTSMLPGAVYAGSLLRGWRLVHCAFAVRALLCGMLRGGKQTDVCLVSAQQVATLARFPLCRVHAAVYQRRCRRRAHHVRALGSGHRPRHPCGHRAH